MQDADRLDAVGAVGVMRCAAFSAVTGRTLLNDEGGTDTAEGHFADKLLLIRDRMKVGLTCPPLMDLTPRHPGDVKRRTDGMRRCVCVLAALELL